MSRSKLGELILVAVVGLMLVACGSDSKDVPSLNADDAQRGEPATDTLAAVAEEEPLDDEAKMLAFTQCLRDQGIEYLDPVVDTDGNVRRPTLAEGVEVSREELGAAYEACAEHIEGLTLGRERPNVSEQVDEFVALATCLRDKGYDVDDPTAETLNQWLVDFRVEFDWDDPKAKTAYEDCNSSD